VLPLQVAARVAACPLVGDQGAVRVEPHLIDREDVGRVGNPAGGGRCTRPSARRCPTRPGPRAGGGLCACSRLAGPRHCTRPAPRAGTGPDRGIDAAVAKTGGSATQHPQPDPSRCHEPRHGALDDRSDPPAPRDPAGAAPAHEHRLAADPQHQLREPGSRPDVRRSREAIIPGRRWSAASWPALLPQPHDLGSLGEVDRLPTGR
jgi:hypothetical protein